MKPKIIIIALSVVFLFAGLFGWGYLGKGANTASVQGAGGPSGAKSPLVAAETFYNFGSISMKNGKVTKEFKVTNPTGKDITVSSVQTSCMCTTAFIVKPDGNIKGPFGMPGMGYTPPANEIIKAAESRLIRVVYDPNAHGPAGVGDINRFVTVTDDSGATLRFEIKATVTP